MQLSNLPARILQAFANAGAKNTIPQTTGVAGAASFNQGFPALTMLPLNAGGVPPAGQDFNGIFYALSLIQQWQSAGGLFPYDAAWSTANNGYPKGSVLLRADGTGFWFNTTDNNTTDPDGATPTGWVPEWQYGITPVTGLTNANVTLSSLQYGRPVITLAGTLTGNVQIIMPAIQGEQWLVANNATGAFSITVKTAAGTGVVVPPGQAISLWCDGTNILSAGPTAAQLAGVVGSTRNLRAGLAAAAASQTFTADEIIVESALGGARYCLGSYSQTLNLATTGAGGMDTGAAPASGFVAAYAIYNPITGARSILGTNATAAAVPEVYGGANMPAGYTASALLSVWPTTAGSLFAVARQYDREMYYYANVYSGGPGSGSFTSLSIAAGVPRNALRWRGNVALTPSTTTNVSAAVCPTISGQGTPGYVAIQTYSAAGLTSGGSIPDSPILTAQTTFWVASGLTAGTMAINSYGYSF